MSNSFSLSIGQIIIGHSLSWYDASFQHLIHHSSVVAPGCNIYHSDILVVTANVWLPEMVSLPNLLPTSNSPTRTTIPMGISTMNNHLSVSAHHSEDSTDEVVENINSTGLNSTPLPSQWDMSINGNNYLPVYNHHHHQQQQQQTTIYDDDQVWYERLRSMATSIGSEQQSSSDSSSNDIQQHHHQLFDVYSQHLPPPMMTTVGLDPHINHYSTNHPFDYYHHPHHIPEYQTMFSF